MEIGSAEYRLAAKETLDAALVAHDAGHFVVAHYLSGLSVECILRAYRWRIDGSWDGRHVLLRLAKSARFYEIVSERAQERFDDHFNEVVRRWSNDHRYASEDKLVKYLNSIEVTTNVKGSKPKENSRVMTEAAHYIVALGTAKWNP